jgi:hypothetical protein
MEAITELGEPEHLTDGEELPLSCTARSPVVASHGPRKKWVAVRIAAALAERANSTDATNDEPGGVPCP